MSDRETTIEQLQKDICKFCSERDWDQFHNPKDLAIGISTEASELLEIFRFKDTEESKKILKDQKMKEDISDELADVLYFVLRFSQMNDIDLSEAVHAKLKKNAEKYPIEKSKGCNKKYNEF